MLIPWGDIVFYVFSLAVAFMGSYFLGKTSAKPREEDLGQIDDMPEQAPRPVRRLSKLLQDQKANNTKKIKKVVIVAHSLPVQFNREGDSGPWSVKWDDSRNWLAAMRMLQDAEEKYEVTWVGCMDASQITEDEQKDVEKELEKHNCAPVWIKFTALGDTYFRGFCKGVLWRLFHYVMPQADPDFGEKWEERWDAYQKVNRMIAEAAVRVATPHAQDAAIWVHGYGCLLVPEFVRDAMPLAKLGIFVHTPWPTTDVVRCLPERLRIINAMLSADIVGFHTYDYARHFLSACRRIAGTDFQAVAGGRLGVKTQSGRTVLVEILHLGINSTFFKDLAEGEKVKATVEKIRKEHEGKKIVIGVDHLDLVKGTLVKLQAYERFLEAHEEWKDKVVLIQVLLPSWNPPEEQKNIRTSVLGIVESIQKNYGEKCIKVLDSKMKGGALTVEETVAYYRAADAALISTFWDGLNLIPYEFTASQDPTRPGVLILSEFMGCTRSLSGALRVNPWSLESVSDKLNHALKMDLKARISNHNRRAGYVLSHTTQRWARNFLADLDMAKSLQRDLSFVHVEQGAGVKQLVGFRKNFTHLQMGSPSEAGSLVSAYNKAQSRIFFLDYDGTLITEDNLEAVQDDLAAQDYTRRCRPSTKLLTLLNALAGDKRNIVFLVSGRERRQLDKWFGRIENLGLAAEKGCFIRWPKRLAQALGKRHAPSGSESPTGLTGVWESAMRERCEWKADVLKLLKA